MVLDKIIGAFAFLSGAPSSSTGTAYEMIMVIVLTILIAYVVGVMISHIVDRKLGDIAIQMPKINVNAPPVPGPSQPSTQTPPQIIFRISENAEGKINLQPLQQTNEQFTQQSSSVAAAARNKRRTKRRIHLPKEPTFEHPNKISTAEPFLSINFDDPVSPDDTPPSLKSRLQSNDDPYKDYTQSFVVDSLDYPIVVDTQPPPTQVKTAIGCVTDSDCNVVNGNGNNVCKSDGTCHCLSGSGLFCHLGPTAYKDPKDMTPEDRERFKLKFRSNMTLQDYKNWLLLYKDEIENLRQNHRRNLLKLLKGGVLTVKDIPNVRIRPSTNASDYFREMYRGAKVSVHMADGSPLVGSNYNQFSDFSPPENTSSNFITGVVDMYKEAGKDDAKALDWMVRPDTNTGLEEEGVGSIYQKYLSKQHDYSDLRKIARVINENERSQVRQNQNISLKTFNSKDLNVGEPQ